MNDDTNDGYEQIIHQSLTEKILLLGAPREITIINGTFTAAFVLGGHMFWVLLISVVVHVVCVIKTKEDPFFFDCFKRYIYNRSYYGT